MITRQCKECGKPFPPIPPTKIFCAERCKVANFQAAKRREKRAALKFDDESRWVWPKELQEWTTR